MTDVQDRLDPLAELLVPDDDEPHPTVSIVVPAMNEEITITEFVKWCQEGMRKAGVAGEILIVDSSTDRTSELAVAAGARVLRVPRRGLGRAYIDALPAVRGRWIVMGDADCTYDFRELRPFIDRFEEGYEYVMGSRWKGTIEHGSMPWLHQRIGTPVTTWLLNKLYDSRFSDIHCGMRGITKAALEQMHLSSQSWEYASEMVLKSVHLGLRTTEVPVTFHKDPDGRVSHHRRLGWFSPFQAAWINMRAMFIYGADFFLVRPGAILLALGLLLTLPLSFGPVRVGGVSLSLFSMLVGLTIGVVGLQSLYLGLVARVFYDYRDQVTWKLLRTFRYTRATCLSLALMVTGIALAAPLGIRFVRDGFTLQGNVVPWSHLAVTGLFALIAGFATFTFVLVLHAAASPAIRRQADR